ncbi:energy-coupling factor ABC transporter ATP-binding protein [Ferroglobus sp.]|uniref:energy-coupling factor ABC transporter ATP-binding protein n=1 Tax=Ferroglobus sp. TaxID=2614230 RepID=UPI0025C61609|nr:ABC transporter ATP-binding protein [Ferroglobus sp.]
MIEAVNVWFSYGDRDVLKGVNFRAKKGEVTVLMGRNGAGKTTLLLHLNGLLKPKKGELIVDGKRIRYTKSDLKWLRRKVAFVFQNPDDQIIAPSVYQEVAFGPVNLGMENVEEVVKNSLKAVGLEGYENRLCSTLSGGEKKRLAIASALATNPDYIVMDEPTAGVDAKGFYSAVEITEKLKEEKGIIVSTHDLDFARAVGDKFVFIDGGKIVYEGDSIDYELARKCGIRTFFSGELVVISHDGDIPEGDFDFIAAMGVKAKKRAEREGINLDIASASLERSILRALEGHRVLLICSAEMVGVVKREVSKFPVNVKFSLESYGEKAVEVRSGSKNLL